MKNHYFIQQLLAATSNWLVYHITITHSSRCPHAQQEVMNNIYQIKYGLCTSEYKLVIREQIHSKTRAI